MVVSETNTLFPLITTHAQISALPQIVAPHQGQNDKYAHPPISAPIPHPSPLTPHPPPPTHLPPHFLQQIFGNAKRNLLALPVYNSILNDARALIRGNSVYRNYVPTLDLHQYRLISKKVHWKLNSWKDEDDELRDFPIIKYSCQVSELQI